MIEHKKLHIGNPGPALVQAFRPPNVDLFRTIKLWNNHKILGVCPLTILKLKIFNKSSMKQIICVSLPILGYNESVDTGILCNINL